MSKMCTMYPGEPLQEVQLSGRIKLASHITEYFKWCNLSAGLSSMAALPRQVKNTTVTGVATYDFQAQNISH